MPVLVGSAGDVVIYYFRVASPQQSRNEMLDAQRYCSKNRLSLEGPFETNNLKTSLGSRICGLQVNLQEIVI